MIPNLGVYYSTPYQCLSLFLQSFLDLLLGDVGGHGLCLQSVDGVLEPLLVLLQLPHLLKHLLLSNVQFLYHLLLALLNVTLTLEPLTTLTLKNINLGGR